MPTCLISLRPHAYISIDLPVISDAGRRSRKFGDRNRNQYGDAAQTCTNGRTEPSEHRREQLVVKCSCYNVINTWEIRSLNDVTWYFAQSPVADLGIWHLSHFVPSFSDCQCCCPLTVFAYAQPFGGNVNVGF